MPTTVPVTVLVSHCPVATLQPEHQLLHHLEAMDLPGPDYDPAQDQAHFCEICGKTFSRARDIPRHVKSHDKSQWTKCAQCDKMFYRKDMLAQHQRKEHTPRS